MERLAGSLPLHLIAVLISSDRDEAMMKYVLCGIRLLHTLCDLSPRHSKLEQVTVTVSVMPINTYCSSLLCRCLNLLVFCMEKDYEAFIVL